MLSVIGLVWSMHLSTWLLLVCASTARRTGRSKGPQCSRSHSMKVRKTVVAPGAEGSQPGGYSPGATAVGQTWKEPCSYVQFVNSNLRGTSCDRLSLPPAGRGRPPSPLPGGCAAGG